jgi:hypothetical protein
MTGVRKKTWGDTGWLLVRLLMGLFLTPIPVMVALGIWHLEIDPRVPALGYWPTLGILWGLGALLAKVKAKWDPDKYWDKK